MTASERIILEAVRESGSNVADLGAKAAEKDGGEIARLAEAVAAWADLKLRAAAPKPATPARQTIVRVFSYYGSPCDLALVAQAIADTHRRGRSVYIEVQDAEPPASNPEGA